MEIRNVETFLYVAEMGSFTAAANHLGYVQSTVTVQIKQLEKELGVLLFDRIGKRVELTTSGQNFMFYANQLIKTAEQAKLMGKEPGMLEGKLRVGILESLLMWVLSEKLPQYNEIFPFIRIRTKTASQSELFHMLKRNELDIVYLLEKKLYDKDFICAWSAPVNIVFVTHPKNPFANKKNVSLHDLVQQPLILTENKGFYRSALDESAMQKGIHLDPLVVFDNTSAIIKLLKKGFGISFLPEYTVNQSIIKNELALIEVKDCNIQFWSQIFYHKDKWLTPQMEGFIELIKKSNI